MKYIPERHHRRSIRLRDYDYSRSGAYYVTICTRNRDCILSKIDSETVGAGLAPAPYDEAAESIARVTKAGEIASRATARVAPTLGQISKFLVISSQTLFPGLDG